MRTIVRCVSATWIRCFAAKGTLSSFLSSVGRASEGLVAPTSVRGPSRSTTRGALFSNFAGSGRIPGARLVRCGRSTPCAPCATPITLSVDHASVLGGPGKRPAPQIPHRPIASNSAATATTLAGLFKRTHRCASHWLTCHQMAPSTQPSWPRWSPPCLRSGQRSESLPDAGCHLDVHMVTNCMSHTMNSSLQILCGRRFAEAQQVLDIVSGSLFHIQGLVAS